MMSELNAELFVDCRNDLAEGPLWHAGRQQLFWFDINGHTLNRAGLDGKILDTWTFDGPVSAAGLVDAETLVVASATGLLRFSIDSGTHELVAPIEAENTDTRSNDGRANPSGGFWIGTMSLSGDMSAGSVYQYRKGRLDTVLAPIGIPNAICFSPDGAMAYCADTPTGIILKCTVDPETGLPVGPWETHIDTSDHPGNPDGAVVDSEGCLWSARWGGHCVIRYAPDGRIDRRIEVPVANVTCPVFGGPDLKTLFLTTAQEGLSAADKADQPHAGSLFFAEVDVPGQSETMVAL